MARGAAGFALSLRSAQWHSPASEPGRIRPDCAPWGAAAGRAGTAPDHPPAGAALERDRDRGLPWRRPSPHGADGATSEENAR